MRRTVTYPLVLLGFFLFLWMNFPKEATDRIRSIPAAILPAPSSLTASNDLVQLQLENQRLRSQLDHAYEWFLFGKRLKEQFEFFKEKHDLVEKRANHLKELLVSQLSSLPALVIYRDPSSWSSSLWVNVGEENNETMGFRMIDKNSPVLSDGVLVGVVDFVGKKQSRVRLITDSGVSPAVRVNRGSLRNRELEHQFQSLIYHLENRDDFFFDDDEKSAFLKDLNRLKQKCGTERWEDGYLAKGELHGSSAPFWRSRAPLLKGIGFNYDYPDHKADKHEQKVPILKGGDLLVTSGLDGVFPAGLIVGTVLHVDPLKEGGYAYNIEVRPAASHLNDLQTVFILPALGE